MAGFDPRKSLALWRAREKFRKARHAYWEKRGNRARLAHWSGLLAAARRMVARRQAQTSPPGPRIVNLDLRPREGSQLSPQGRLRAVTGHYTAGPVDRDDAHAEAMFRGIDRYHKGKGWTMAGYPFGIARSGTLFLLRPATAIGAHVLNQNSGNVGVVCNGSTGDKPTVEQAATLRWLLANAHTSALPAAWRVDLRGLPVKGHNDWMATECPGDFKAMYVSKGTTR